MSDDDGSGLTVTKHPKWTSIRTKTRYELDRNLTSNLKRRSTAEGREQVGISMSNKSLRPTTTKMTDAQFMTASR